MTGQNDNRDEDQDNRIQNHGHAGQGGQTQFRGGGREQPNQDPVAPEPMSFHTTEGSETGAEDAPSDVEISDEDQEAAANDDSQARTSGV